MKAGMRFLSATPALATLALALAACSTPAPSLPSMGVDAAFEPRHLCGMGISPEIRLAGVPANAAQYRVRMINLDALFSRTWQEDFPVQGPVIPEGAGRSYPAPCPAQRLVFDHRIEVDALDASGTPIATGSRIVAVAALPDLAPEPGRGVPTDRTATRMPSEAPPNSFGDTRPPPGLYGGPSSR